MTKDYSFRLIRIKTLGASEGLADFLNTREGVLDLEAEASGVRFKFSCSPQDQVELLQEVVQQDFSIASFEETETNIEDILLGLNATPEA